jgi:signal peptidase I
MTRTHLGTILAATLFAAWYLLLGPAVIGGPATYVVVDGTSMQPTLVDGDLAIVRRSDAYAVGDVIAFQLPDGDPDARGLVIHRIVGGSAKDGFVTQGDNRSGQDPWRPVPADIVGSVWITAAGAGSYLAMLRDPLVMAPLAAGVTVFLVLLGGGDGDRTEPRPPRHSPIDRLRRLLGRKRAPM